MAEEAPPPKPAPKAEFTTPSILQNFHILEISDSYTARTTEHPIEDGSVITDNKVILPLRLTVRAYLTSEEYSGGGGDDGKTGPFVTLKKLLNSRSDSDLAAINTKTGDNIANLMMTKLTKRETSEKFDAFEVTMEFVELVKVSSSGKPSDPDNSSSQST